MTLPRILYAVPRTLQVRMEIARAIRTFAKPDDVKRLRKQGNVDAPLSVREIAVEIVRDILQDLRKAGFRPDQPRWPRGSGDVSGRWSGGAGEAPPASPKPPPQELPPRSWGIGHNQGPPLDDPPDIPNVKPEDESEIWNFAKAA